MHVAYTKALTRAAAAIIPHMAGPPSQWKLHLTDDCGVLYSAAAAFLLEAAALAAPFRCMILAIEGHHACRGALQVHQIMRPLSAEHS